jgi:hypothetical protein
LGISAKFIDSGKVLGKGAAYSSVLAKSFGSVLYKDLPLKVKINLFSTHQKADTLKGKDDILSLFEVSK